MNIANVLTANSEKRLQLEGVLGGGVGEEDGEEAGEDGEEDGEDDGGDEEGSGVEPTTSILCVPIFNSADQGKCF